MKSFIHVAIVGDFLSLPLDIVPPPAAWDVNPDMLEDLTHINIKVDRIYHLHGLDKLGKAVQTGVVAPERPIPMSFPRVAYLDAPSPYE